MVGKALARHPRDSFYLSTKFPGYDVSNFPHAAEIFERQLEKCQVDHFDFFLLHNVNESNIDAYLNPAFGILEYFLKEKAAGRIGHLGFSVHGTYDIMVRFLEVYGPYMEFCQIELNYFDWEFQDAKAKTDELNRRNIPIWVMEPLRGGQLASLSPEDTAKLAALRPRETVPGWAFRYLQTIPGVTMVLSGMSTMEQLRANIATYETCEPLTGEEMSMLLAIARNMAAKTAVPCTACHYCVKYCPMDLDIPTLLHLYNEACMEGSGNFIAPMALSALEPGKGPEDCLGCGSCAAVCPQSIDIPTHLAAFAEKMGRA